MQHKWSHLPNAMHIDCVLASVKEHPEAWNAARGVAWNAARDAAWNAARAAARVAARDQSRVAAGITAGITAGDAVRDAAYRAAWDAAWGAITALIAWDDSVQYLDLPSDQLAVWAVISDDPACVLLLPAVQAFETIRQPIYSEQL